MKTTSITRIARALTAFALTAAFVACQNGFTSASDSGSTAGSSGAAAASGGAVGNIVLNIPEIASWICQAGAASADLSGSRVGAPSKAMAITNKAKVQVQTEAGVDVIAPVYSNTYTNGLYGHASSITIGYVPVGTKYKVILSCYNTNVSATTPTVVGTATGVSITKDTATTVNITCMPQSASSLALETPASLNLAQSCESWYAIPVTSSTKYYITCDNSNIAVGVFDASGSYLGYLNSGYLCVQPSGTTLYIAAVSFSSPSILSGSLKVSTTIPTLNEGAIGAPVGLALGTNRVFKVGPGGTSQESSYYSFIVSSAGVHAFDSLSGGYSLYLYSDIAFSSPLDSATNLSKGAELGNLSLGTYYLKVVNNISSSIQYFNAQLLDPAAYAAAKASGGCDGSTASPQSVALGSSFSGKVGCRFWDYYSYYSFVVATAGDYKIFLTGLGSMDSVDFRLGNSPSDTNRLLMSGFSSSNTASPEIFLPAGTYYFSISNWNSANLSYSLTVSHAAEPIYTDLAVTTTDSWSSFSASSNSPYQWHRARVTPGTTYLLYCNNGYEGDGTYNAYTWVTAYNSDRSSPYFTNMNNGYSTPQPIAVPAGQDYLIISVRVDGWHSGFSGNYALKLKEVPADTGTIHVTAY